MDIILFRTSKVSAKDSSFLSCQLAAREDVTMFECYYEVEKDTKRKVDS